MEQISDNRKYMEDQFKLLNETLSSLSARITTLEGKQTDIEKSLTFHGDEISDLQQKVQDIDMLKQQIDALKQAQQNQASTMQRTADQLQADKNLKTLRIAGITKTHNEDLPYIVTKLATVMSCTNINKHDIESVFRPKDKDRSPTDLIIVRFATMSKRDEFYNGRKCLAKNNLTTKDLGLSTSNKIFINESLSRATQSLFYHARKRKTELNYKFIWTYHAQIFMRKSNDVDMVKITNQESLDQLT